MRKPNALTGRDLSAALAVVVVWGVNFAVMKFALRDFSPFQLGAARFVFAVLPLALVIRPPAIHWKWVVLYGLFQGLGQFGILFITLKVGMTAALASVILQTQRFASGFLQIRSRPRNPCLWLTLPLAGRVEDFHLQVGTPCRPHQKNMVLKDHVHSKFRSCRYLFNLKKTSTMTCRTSNQGRPAGAWSGQTLSCRSGGGRPVGSKCRQQRPSYS